MLCMTACDVCAAHAMPQALDRGSSSDSIPFIEEVDEEPAGPEEAGGAELAAKRPKRMQRLWIIQQLCNRGTLYEAVDRWEGERLV